MWATLPSASSTSASACLHAAQWLAPLKRGRQFCASISFNSARVDDLKHRFRWRRTGSRVSTLDHLPITDGRQATRTEHGCRFLPRSVSERMPQVCCRLDCERPARPCRAVRSCPRPASQARSAAEEISRCSSRMLGLPQHHEHDFPNFHVVNQSNAYSRRKTSPALFFR
jgi:hypothetical protein